VILCGERFLTASLKQSAENIAKWQAGRVEQPEQVSLMASRS
jgi:hypothetical protein